MKYSVILSGFVLFFLSAFAPTTAEAAQITYPEAKAALVLPTDKATVYFYRPKKMRLSGVSFYMNEKDGLATRFISNADIDLLFLKPGQTAFTTKKSMMIKPTEFALNVEAGKVYYVRVTLSASGMKSIPSFELVTEDQAKGEMANCRVFVSRAVKSDHRKFTDYVAGNKTE